mmetsp:Transcript_40244/g.84399  ORF Transcript_40244/g.84399 Transcript_40244/m.84399 type:complete len:280 (-) Transcript_40244:433-1272(-)
MSAACVLLHCAAPLLSCELNAQCRAWSLCNVGCALHREPAQALACQIRCQDLYKPTDAGAQGFAEITAFSECAISDYHCVPQTRMTCSQPSQVADSFRLEEFVGKWYITRGLNPLFDCFDCQVHRFDLNRTLLKPLRADMRYLVKEDLKCMHPDCTYLPRRVHQAFVGDTSENAHLINHNNGRAESHYADDCGAVLYTRAETFEALSAAEQNDVAVAIQEIATLIGDIVWVRPLRLHPGAARAIARLTALVYSMYHKWTIPYPGGGFRTQGCRADAKQA